MNLTPSFSAQQAPNLVVANQRLHLDLAEARAENAELRGAVQARDAVIRRARRALAAGDVDAARTALGVEEL